MDNTAHLIKLIKPYHSIWNHKSNLYGNKGTRARDLSLISNEMNISS